VWSFEWSINVDFDLSSSAVLSDLSYELGLDTDPGATAAFIAFDPINGGNPGEAGAVFWDHAMGTNATLNGGGTSAADASAYATAIDSNNVAQNSWKPHWFIAGFDPTLDGVYDFYLAAFDGSTEVARTEMQIIVGAGSNVSVSEPGTMLLLGLGLLGAGFRLRGAPRPA
jgi:hypothetical protein